MCPDSSNDHYSALLSERQVAHRLGISVRTVQAWRVSGDGPEFIRLGRRTIRYREIDLAAWIATCQMRSTSQQ
jgi:predicted DNA-binding transcriptional regulator AlpA